MKEAEIKEAASLKVKGLLYSYLLIARLPSIVTVSELPVHFAVSCVKDLRLMTEFLYNNL